MALEEYRKKIADLSVNEQKLRDLYLRDLSLGRIQGPPTGYASIDKPWLKYYSEEAILGDIQYDSVYESLVSLNKNNMNKVALNYFGKKYTYFELKEKIDIIAKSFLESGVRPGDVVTLALPNIPENIFCFYALNKIGAVANFVDLRMKGEKFVHAINSKNSKLIVASDIFIKNLEEIVLDTNLEKIIIASPSDSLPFGIKQLYKLKNGKISSDMDFILWKEFEKFGKKSLIDSKHINKVTDAACILHTSGTTGSPKGVVLTNRNFMAMAHQVKNSGLKYKDNDVFLSHVPPFLAYNILAATNNPLSMGLEIKMLPDYQPTKFVENLIKYKPNHVIAGPADWNNFIDNDKIDGVDFSFLISMISGSDKIPEERKKEINGSLAARGCEEKLLEGYGLTEVGAAAVMNLPGHIVSNSVGVPLRFVNVGIFKEGTNQELPFGEDGEICLSGPTLMEGYYDNMQETSFVKIIHEDGIVWLHTGDLGNINEDGNLFLKGRIKRIIVRHDGIKVSPYDLEKIVTQIPVVKDCCVVGLPDDDHGYGSIPVAAVVLENDSLLSNSEINDLLFAKCESQLSEKYVPKEFVVVDEFPLTSVGKVDYKKLTEDLKTRNNNKVLRKNK